VTGDLPSIPLVVLKQEVIVELDELTQNAAMVQKIDDALEVAASESVYKNLQVMEKSLESQRVQAKDPFLKIGRQIDEAIKPYANTIKLERARIGDLLLAYNRKVEQARIIAQQKIDEQQRLLEKQKQEQLKAGIPPAKVEVPKIVVPVAAPVSTVITSQKRKVLVIDDINKIPITHMGVRLLVPDEKAIFNLLKAGVPIEGCRIGEDESSRAK
jgi:hypothetical protein